MHDSEHAESYDTVLRVMADALILIRATQNILEANIRADVFHNTPAKIASRHSPSDVEAEIFVRAARLKCGKQIEAMFVSVRQRCIS
jgi:hypothetical protein